MNKILLEKLEKLVNRQNKKYIQDKDNEVLLINWIDQDIINKSIRSKANESLRMSTEVLNCRLSLIMLTKKEGREKGEGRGGGEGENALHFDCQACPNEWNTRFHFVRSFILVNSISQIDYSSSSARVYMYK